VHSLSELANRTRRSNDAPYAIANTVALLRGFRLKDATVLEATIAGGVGVP
jgi:hypothetical protein